MRSNIELQRGLRLLEDMLLTEGIPSFCYNSEETVEDPNNLLGDPSISIVLYSDVFIPQTRRFLREKRREILDIFGPDVEHASQFLPYYLSYLVLGEYPKTYSNTYLSTSFKNLQSPHVINHPIVGFSLKVVGIIEGPSSKSFGGIKTDVEDILNDFNRRSRYLKILDFDYGTLTSRVQFGPDTIRYENVTLSLGPT